MLNFERVPFNEFNEFQKTAPCKASPVFEVYFNIHLSIQIATQWLKAAERQNRFYRWISRNKQVFKKRLRVFFRNVPRMLSSKFQAFIFSRHRKSCRTVLALTQYIALTLFFNRIISHREKVVLQYILITSSFHVEQQLTSY